MKLINYMNLYEPEIHYIISTSKYAAKELEYDIGVCYGYDWLIDVNAPENKDRIHYNFHPAPLPEYKDWGNYARGLHDLKTGKIKEWGASLHCIDEGIDSGTVLRVMNVPLLSIPVDVSELGDAVHYYMFQLYRQTIRALQFKPKTKEELDRLC